MDNGGGILRISRSINVTPSEVRLNVEEPVNNASVGSSFRVSGWAIATNSVARVEVLVDNALTATATYGSDRPDVCVVFPGFPDCPNVGFVADLTGLTEGAHTLTVRVVDTEDALLVANLERSQDVKKITAYLQAEALKHLL